MVVGFARQLAFLDEGRGIIADQVLVVVIEEFHERCLIGRREAPEEIAIEVIDVNLVCNRTIDQQFAPLLIEEDIIDIGVFLAALPFAVNLFHGLPALPVEKEDVAIVHPVLHDDILIADGLHIALRQIVVRCFQRDIFHIHKVLSHQLLLRIVGTRIDGNKLIPLLSFAATYQEEQGDEGGRQCFSVHVYKIYWV